MKQKSSLNGGWKKKKYYDSARKRRSGFTVTTIFLKTCDKNMHDDDGVVFTSWVLPFWLQQL
jgi:hypothetical protein